MRWSWFFCASMAALPSLASADPVQTQATFGFSAGSNILGGNIDFLVPLSGSENSAWLLNPRFSLVDQGSPSSSLGLVYRRVLPKAHLLIGGNAFVDTTTTWAGSQVFQSGVGVELLGDILDFRANYYFPADREHLVNQFDTEETTSRTERSSKRSVARYESYSSNVTVSQSVRTVGLVSTGEPEGRGHDVVVPVTSHLTTDTLKTTTIRSTRTVTEKTILSTVATTYTTRTRRFFQQYEKGREGFDAEIGFKLFSSPNSALRAFGGYYRFDGPYGGTIEGPKARLEFRLGPFFTFDAEAYEDKELKGADYFVGARLTLPFGPGADLKKGFFRLTSGAKVARTPQDRLRTELVVRDRRAHTQISGPREDLARRKSKVSKSTKVTTSTKVSSARYTTESRKTESSRVETTKTQDVVAASDITVVDGDASTATENGTFENPYSSISHAVSNAGGNRTIFVEEKSTGAGAYEENVALQNGQVLTSSIPLKIVESQTGQTVYSGRYQTVSRPVIRPVTGSNAVAISGSSTVERIAIDGSGFNGDGISVSPGVSGAQVRVLDSDIRQIRGDAINVNVASSPGVSVELAGNSISATNDLGSGIYVSSASDNLSLVVRDNTVRFDGTLTNGVFVQNTGGAFRSEIRSNDIDVTGASSAALVVLNAGAAGNIDISDNLIRAGGAFSQSLLVDNSAQGSSLVIGGNVIANSDVLGEAFRVSNSADHVDIHVTSNNVTDSGGTGVINFVNTGANVNVQIQDNFSAKSGEIISDQMVARTRLAPVPEKLQPTVASVNLRDVFGADQLSFPILFSDNQTVEAEEPQFPGFFPAFVFADVVEPDNDSSPELPFVRGLESFRTNTVTQMGFAPDFGDIKPGLGDVRVMSYQPTPVAVRNSSVASMTFISSSSVSSTESTWPTSISTSLQLENFP